MRSRSSSVNAPHFALTFPLTCFQFPSMRFQSISSSVSSAPTGASQKKTHGSWGSSTLYVHPDADLINEALRVGLRQSLDLQWIEAAAAFDADRVPEEAAIMGHLGKMRHRQVLVC